PSSRAMTASPARLWPDVVSTIWHAAVWRSLPVANRDGLLSLQTFSAKAQRVWKRQPEGGLIGLGGSPVIGGSLVRLSGSSDGIAESNARVYGWRASRHSASTGPVSTTSPRYITSTRSEMKRTTLRSCEMNT